MKLTKTLAAAAVIAFVAAGCSKADEPAPTETGSVADDMGVAPVMVGGAEMLPSRNIVENASNSPIHSTLVAAVKQAELVDTLSGAGPFTVFAPTNDAFGKLPAGTVDGLLTAAQKPQLTAILTYHVVPGTVMAADLVGLITAGNGKAVVKTVQGQDLTATLDGEMVKLTDANGGVATVTQADVAQSNGVIHVIDTVLTPAG